MQKLTKNVDSLMSLDDTPCIITTISGERLVGLATYYELQKVIFLRPKGEKIQAIDIKEIITKY